MIAPQCDPNDPRIKCVGRDDASRRGDFRFNFDHWRWEWTATNDDGWSDFGQCPWCHGLLPSPDAMAEHILTVINAEDEA